MPAPTLVSKGSTAARHDMSVILVTGSYDHEIRFWEAWSGICSRTIARTGEAGVSVYAFATGRPLNAFPRSK
jgi:G protein beta subunit-like protein